MKGTPPKQDTAERHITNAVQDAQALDWTTGDCVTIERAAVVGGGAVGAGIALALLDAGIAVTVLEEDADAVHYAQANLNRAGTLISRLTVTDDYAAARDATLVIEATTGSMDSTHEIFGKLAATLSSDAILATNTPYIDVAEIAARVTNPARVLGLYFTAPAQTTRLLEIVRGDATRTTALATGFALAERLQKIPILSAGSGGPIGHRLSARYHEAADTVFMDGSTPWEVDEAMVEFGFAMGPYERQDLTGLDIAYAIRRHGAATRDPNRRDIPITDRMIELGKLGRKTGAGWYRYPGGGGKVDDPIVADLANEEAHFAGITRTDYNPDEICERLLLAMINEGAELLHTGVAQSARDIDLVSVFGLGFPRARGGLMHYADTIGAGSVVARLTDFAKEDPVAWQVSALLRRCARDGTLIGDATPSLRRPNL